MRALLLSLMLTSCTIDVDIGTSADIPDATAIPPDGSQQPDAIPREEDAAGPLPDASIPPDAG